MVNLKDPVMVNSDHREMLEREDLWGQWPLLPLIRRTGPPEGREAPWGNAGFVISGRPTTVYLGVIFAAEEAVSAKRKIEYPSADAVIADGWEVD